MPYWRLYYHLIWTTEGRQPLIRPEIEGQSYEAIRDKVTSLGGEAFEIGGTGDHVHLAVTIPPSISVARFAGEVKGASSFHVNHLPDNPHTLEWQRGYGVVSFRRDNLNQVVEYIRLQREHHASGELSPSLEECTGADAAKPTCVREAAAEYDPSPWG